MSKTQFEKYLKADTTKKYLLWKKYFSEILTGDDKTCKTLFLSEFQ